MVLVLFEKSTWRKPLLPIMVGVKGLVMQSRTVELLIDGRLKFQLSTCSFKLSLKDKTHCQMLVTYQRECFAFQSCDFGKQNTRGNVSKISVRLTGNQHIGSKSTNHSPLTWHREGQVTLVAVIGGFQSDLSITRKTDGILETFPRVFCFPKLRIFENGGNRVHHLKGY